MKDYNSMTDHEILMELLQDKRRNDRNRYIKYALIGIIALLVVGALMVYIPKIVAIINKYNEIMDKLNQIDTHIDTIFDKFDFNALEDIKELMSKIQTLISKISFGF